MFTRLNCLFMVFDSAETAVERAISIECIFCFCFCHLRILCYMDNIFMDNEYKCVLYLCVLRMQKYDDFIHCKMMQSLHEARSNFPCHIHTLSLRVECVCATATQVLGRKTMALGFHMVSMHDMHLRLYNITTTYSEYLRIHTMHMHVHVHVNISIKAKPSVRLWMEFPSFQSSGKTTMQRASE